MVNHSDCDREGCILILGGDTASCERGPKISRCRRKFAYIQDKFLCPEGEWYTEVTNEGTPVKGVPKVFFWKSMYHTVRYYDYLVTKVKA